MATTGRPVLNVAMDEDTRESFRDFCVRYGVSATGLLEAFARTAADQGPQGATVADLPGWLVQVVVDARKIDGDRKRRS
jgi:hypothetical protein